MNDDSKNLFYLTGYNGYGFLVLKKSINVKNRDKRIKDNKEKRSNHIEYSFSYKSNLYVPMLEYETAKNTAHVNVETFSKLSDIIGNVKRIYVPFSDISMNFLALKKRGMKFVNIDKEIMKLRLIKDDNEIKYIAKACRFGDKIISEFVDNFKMFNTEKDIEKFLKKRTIDYGLELAFEPIVANNTSEVHYSASNKKLKEGFLLIDFGVKYNGYCSDMTRMFYIGNPTKKEIDDYFLVRYVHDKVISMIKKGLNLNVLESFARDKLGRDYVHSLGHGVGLNIHESPNFKDFTLEDNVVFTVEPGIYRNNSRRRYGIRIEDTILVKDGKPKLLTKFTRDLVFLNR